MKRNIIWLVGIVAVAVLVILYGTHSQPEHIIKIGVIAPRTGGAAGYGEPLARGIALAQADLGTTKNTYEVIFEDDGTNPATSASAAQKLINIDKVQALITVTSGTGNAAAPIATKAGVTHFCVCANAPLADNITNFTYLALPDKEAAAWVAEAKFRGARTIAIISQNHPGMNLIADYVKKDLAAAGIKLSFEERYDPSVKDFKTVLSKAKATAPDMYFIGAFPPSLDVIASEIGNLGIKNIGGVGTFAIAADVKLLEGGWYTDASLQDPAFKERFEKEFPNVKFNARTAPHGYDVFNILVKGIESEGGVAAYVRNLLRYEGKIGTATKPADGGSFDAPYGIWEIKAGKTVQIK